MSSFCLSVCHLLYDITVREREKERKKVQYVNSLYFKFLSGFVLVEEVSGFSELMIEILFVCAMCLPIINPLLLSLNR